MTERNVSVVGGTDGLTGAKIDGRFRQRRSLELERVTFLVTRSAKENQVFEWLVADVLVVQVVDLKPNAFRATVLALPVVAPLHLTYALSPFGRLPICLVVEGRRRRLGLANDVLPVLVFELELEEQVQPRARFHRSEPLAVVDVNKPTSASLIDLKPVVVP
jgi:hypothetical protein